jgi:hypothetical protein
VKPAQIVATAESLRRMLALVDAGEMTVSIATRHRMEGALAALEAVNGEPSSLLDTLGLAGKDRLV